MNKIAIICDGKEISYGMTLKHLFMYKNTETNFTSSLGGHISVEIYTLASYKHSNISENACRVFINSSADGLSHKNEVFNDDGIYVYKSQNDYYVLAMPEVLINKEYSTFIKKANKIQNEYNKFEADFVNKVNCNDQNWLPHEFSELSSKGIWGKNKFLKDITQQQFDYISYNLYLIFTAGGENDVRL